MWIQLIEAAVVVGLYVYHRWVEDHPATPLPPQIQVPRTAEGSPIALVYGQCRIRSPVVVWAGNYLAPGDHWDSVATGITGLTADHYSVDILFCLGIPFYSAAAAGLHSPSTLLAAWAGDTPMAMLINNVASGAPAQACYAGPAPGLEGPNTFSFTGVYYRGTWDQNVLDGSTADGTTPPTIDPALATGVGPGTFPDDINYNASANGTSLLAAAVQGNADGQIPGCRGQMMLFAHVGLAQSSTLPAFQFEVLSTQTGSAADLGNSFDFSGLGIAGDADPAAVILDILTSPWGKVGLPLAQINVPSFQAASNTLFAERQGYSRVFEQAADADAMIKDILAQIDGVLYQEPTTGQLTLKLIRFDYNAATLDDINPGNAERPESGWYTVQGWAEVPNQVRVTYIDRSNNYTETVAVAQDPSLVVSNGGRIRSVSVRHEGCCVQQLAQQIAARELAAVGRPMVRATVTVSRAFYAHRPGDVVTLTWPELGVSGMVMRIAAIDFGLLRNGKIKMSLMRDVFDVKAGAFF